jgi:hypothetical protein
VVAQGTLREIEQNPASQTGHCLRTPLCHPVRKSRRSLGEVAHWLEIRDAHANNLKHVHARFPIGRFSVITGISGSGKSTLMRSVLLPAVQQALGSARASRAGDGALAIANFSPFCSSLPATRELGCGEAPQPAREGRALPDLNRPITCGLSSPGVIAI